MKNTIVVLFILTLFTSCGGTKRVIENTPKTTEVVVSTTPKQPEQPAVPETPNSVEKIEPTHTEPIQQPTTETIETNVEDATETTKEAFNHDAWNMLLQEYVSKATEMPLLITFLL